MLDDPHDRMLDDSPTLLEEDPCETIMSRRLVTRHLFYSLPNLLLGDGGVEVLQGMGLNAQFLPIEILIARTSPAHDLGEVIMDDLLFFLVVGHPTMSML